LYALVNTNFKSEENLVMDSSIVGNYRIIEPVSTDSDVHLAIHTATKERYAVKVLYKNSSAEEIERAKKETEILRKLNELKNPYIIKYIESFETDTAFCLVMEYIKGGELMEHILEKGPISEKETHRLYNQILSAIDTCHTNQIVHRDIKLQNLLMDSEQNIRLIDFGLSDFAETSSSLESSFRGTPAYAAPEILLGTHSKGQEVDIWSLGIVLYAMLTAEFPFNTIGQILKGKYPQPANVSPECNDLLKKMLSSIKNERITLEEVRKHPWIKKNNQSLRASTDLTEYGEETPPLKKPRHLDFKDLD